jgi:hypothetical protein
MFSAPSLKLINYFNDLTKKFEYPGRKYKKSLNIIKIFNVYLTDDVYIGRRTVYPLYYNKFVFILILIVYCELFNKRYNIYNTVNCNQVLYKITEGLINIKGYYINSGARYVANNIIKLRF